MNQTVPVFYKRFQRALKITIERSLLFQLFDEPSEAALIAVENVGGNLRLLWVEHDQFAEADGLLGILNDKHQLTD